MGYRIGSSKGPKYLLEFLEGTCEYENNFFCFFREKDNDYKGIKTRASFNSSLPAGSVKSAWFSCKNTFDIVQYFPIFSAERCLFSYV